MPQPTDYVVDPLLTELSVAYKNFDMIGTQLMPVHEVPQKYGIYYEFDKAAFKVENSLRTGVARANRVDFGLVKRTFGPLLEHSLEEPVEWELRDTYPTPMDAYTDATNNVTQKLDLGLEKEIATALLDTAVITQNQSLSGTSRWDDYANSDPIYDVKYAKDQVQAGAFVLANVIAMGYPVWSAVSIHPDLLGRLSVATVRVLTEELFGALVGIPKVLIGRAVENTAAEGQSETMTYLWGKNVIVAYVAPTPAMKQITLGWTLRLKGGRSVDRWTEEAYKSDFVRVTDYYMIKVVAAAAEYLYKTVVN